MLHRLTATQYENAIRDLFGSGVVVTTTLEPDESVEGLLVVGASVNSLSSSGVEKYETASYALAEAVLADATARATWLSCTPQDTVDATCAAEILSALGRRAWRRSLSSSELDALVALAGLAAETLGDFEDGLGYGIAAVLQSPSFLYRIEVGEEDPESPGTLRYTNDEMASRLSFFLWNTIPDEALLDAAAAGLLTDDEGLAAEVERMLADDKANDGVRNLFDEIFTLYALEDLSKDPTIFVHFSSDVGASAREQTLSDIESLVLVADGDYRDLFTATETIIDRKLAAIYNVAAPSPDGFGAVELPESGGRRGLLGQLSILAQFSHSTVTSPTRRGLFVREILLCQPLPDPPATVTTVVPDASEDAPTMRERLEQHRDDSSCAACHVLTDPIGLGLENFDGLGSWRDTENGADIDPSGELDGAAFANAWELGAAVSAHERLGPCLADTLYRYAQGRIEEDADAETVAWHAEGFADEGYRVGFLLRDIATSPAFRHTAAVE